MGNRVTQNLRERLFEHLQTMELGFFTSTKTGVIQSRLGNDVGAIQAVVTQTGPTALFNAVTVIASLIGMAALSWHLTVMSLMILPPFVFLQMRVGRVSRRTAASAQASLSDMSVITQETLSVSGVLLAKLFSRQGFESARYRSETSRQAELRLRQALTGRYFLAFFQAFFGITPAVAYLIAGHVGLTSGGILTAGTLVAFTALQARVLLPVVQLLGIGLNIQISLAVFARIFEYLDLKPRVVEAIDAIDINEDETVGDIRFDGVWFSYPSDTATECSEKEKDQPYSQDPGTKHSISPEEAAVKYPPQKHQCDASGPAWALRDLSIHIAPGQFAAIVGPSGAGKTTLSYLIPRLYDVDQGAVLIDNHDVRRLRQSALSNMIGVVTQEAYLFHGTIRENLRYAKEDADDCQLEAAARAANIHDR
ncbi:MAG: ABC transporter ATP-binding protein, partial [Candidatus Binatia bacterium]